MKYDYDEHSFFIPLDCPWECHRVGGPWISENPDCPFHGDDQIPPEELTQETIDQMVEEKKAENWNNWSVWSEDE